ncbi:MAG: serine hydrolase [Eubacteriales bacterium]|nr:serine hydrolase [Eubacteriales bacterium]
MAYNEKYGDLARQKDYARRQHIMRMKMKRKRQIFIRKCFLAAAMFAAVAGFVNLGIAGKEQTDKASELVETETIAVAADNDVTQNKVNEVKAPLVPYAQKNENYQEVMDEAVFSPYIAVIEVESGKLIAGRNSDSIIYPASMTKVMTLLVAVENIDDFSKTYTFGTELLNSLYIEEATVAGFSEGETVGVDDLLYGLILPSGADSAVAVATIAAGSEEDFVSLMNGKAKEMGLKNTHFANPTGLHSEEQYTTPAEMAMIMEVAMSNPTCAKYLSTYQHTTSATAQHPEGILLTSTMFSRMYGDEVEGVLITAGKTGFTNEALHCLVNFAQKNGKHYVTVEAGAQDKWHTIFDSFALFRDYAI